jgi:hypothetical protein
MSKLEFSLCVHDENYSKQDLLLNSELFQDGELVLVKAKNQKLVLKVKKHLDLKQLQISLAQQIASLFELLPRSLIQVWKIVEYEKFCGSRMEISFRDQYIGRVFLINFRYNLPY